MVETRSGMSSRFTLDHSSFEKLLSAAWVLQCLHDQLHNREVGRGEAVAERVKTPEVSEIGLPTLLAPLENVVQPSSGLVCRQNALDVLDDGRAGDEVLGEVVVQQPEQRGTLSFGAPAKAEPRTVEREPSLHSANLAALPTSKPPLSFVEKLAGDDQKERARLAFNLYSAKLRTAFRQTLDAFIKLRPALRVNLTLPALRATAIAVPVLALTLVAASLLLETWHRVPVDSTQGISRTGALAAALPANDSLTTQTTTKRASSQDHKRISNRSPSRSSEVLSPRSSHREVTDPATLSAVRRLSKYEVRSLRRQAKYGDSSAAFTLGMAYEVGHPVPQNCAEAARWVTTAAEAGDAAAEYNLGLRYRDGDGIPANHAESAKWLRKAAARRYPKASVALKMLASR